MNQNWFFVCCVVVVNVLYDCRCHDFFLIVVSVMSSFSLFFVFSSLSFLPCHHGLVFNFFSYSKISEKLPDFVVLWIFMRKIILNSIFLTNFWTKFVQIYLLLPKCMPSSLYFQKQTVKIRHNLIMIVTVLYESLSRQTVKHKD